MRSRALLSRNEDGVVLVLCLLTVIILTLLGISATTTSRLEVEISGNDKTSKESFYAAEMALTSGETVIENLPNRIAFNEGTPGRYTKGPAGVVPDPTQYPQPAWNVLVWDNAHSTVVTAVPSGLSTLYNAPRYTIAAGIMQRESLRTGINLPRGIYPFEIAARGTGSNIASETVLQSIYAKRYN